MEQIQQNTQDEYFKYRLKDDESSYFNVCLQNNKVFLNFYEGSSARYIYYEIGSDKIKINGSEQDFGHCNTLMDFLQTLAKKTESKEISLGGEKSITQIKELYDYYCGSHKKDDKEQTNIVQNTTNNQEYQVEKSNIEKRGKEDNQEVNNSNLDVNMIKKKDNAYQITFGDKNSSGDLNDTNINCAKDDPINIISSDENIYNSFNEIPTQEKSKKITAEIDINTLEEKVVISFYEQLQNDLSIDTKEANKNIVSKKKLISLKHKKTDDVFPSADINDYIVFNDDKSKDTDKEKGKMCDKKKIREILFKIQNPLKDDILKVHTWASVNIQILMWLKSVCDKNITSLRDENNTVEIKKNVNNEDENNKTSLRSLDEVYALRNELKKKMAEYFSFSPFISQKNESPGMKCIKINLPYDQQDLVFYIDAQEKQIHDFSNIPSDDSKDFHHKKDNCNKISYLKETELRDYIKQQLYKKCYNNNDDIDEVKQLWQKKIDKFVDDLDLSQILMREIKNTGLIESLSQNPCIRALCCIYD